MSDPKVSQDASLEMGGQRLSIEAGDTILDVARRAGVGLPHQPASEKRVHLKYAEEDIAAFVASVKDMPAAER